VRIGKILIGVGAIASLALIGAISYAIIYGYATRRGWVGVADKTLWDWLNLLIIPFVIAVVGTVGGYFFTRAENRTAQAIAERRTQDEALQNYLNQIGELLLDKGRPLRDSKEGDEVRTLARARTVTALERLNASRKASVMRFLGESGLIQKESEHQEHVTSQPVISLSGADLSGVDLRGLYVKDALHSVGYLRHVYRMVRGTYYLTAMGFSSTAANMGGNFLRGANLSFADLRGADLMGTDLSGADLMGTDLSGANLGGANLSDVNPFGINLSQANLKGAKGVTNEQLLEWPFFQLEGATLPNGQKYNNRIARRRSHVLESLYQRQGEQEDSGGENSSPS
jgi:hypothetical protein